MAGLSIANGLDQARLARLAMDWSWHCRVDFRHRYFDGPLVVCADSDSWLVHRELTTPVAAAGLARRAASPECCGPM